jgi:hypothetical protein
MDGERENELVLTIVKNGRTAFDKFLIKIFESRKFYNTKHTQKNLFKNRSRRRKRINLKEMRKRTVEGM